MYIIIRDYMRVYECVCARVRESVMNVFNNLLHVPSTRLF